MIFCLAHDSRSHAGLFFRPINAFWAELLGELRDENFQDFAAWEGNGEFERTMLQNSSLLTFQGSFLVLLLINVQSHLPYTSRERISQQLPDFVNLAIYKIQQSSVSKISVGRTQTNPEMKIQCEVCEKAEAEVLCCSDEAVLCKSCDEKVHTANKLFQRHNRVTLLKHNSTSSGIPLCDICQERTGYVFCLEDRALLCKNCDGAIHKCTSHQRFLASGVHVSLQSCIEDSECSTSLSSSIFQIHPSGESEAGNSEVDLEKERHEGNR